MEPSLEQYIQFFNVRATNGYIEVVSGPIQAKTQSFYSTWLQKADEKPQRRSEQEQAKREFERASRKRMGHSRAIGSSDA